MRYAKDHKQQTRQRIVAVAADRFRAKGIDNEGIASIMNAAGLTHGAFFNHFTSKEDLVRAAVAAAMDERIELLGNRLIAGETILDYVKTYLATHHATAAPLRCPVATLAPDVSRHSSPVRDAFTEGVKSLIGLVATHWPQASKKEAQSRALGLYGLIAGCLEMARATEDEAFAQIILAAGIESAMLLLNRQ